MGSMLPTTWEGRFVILFTPQLVASQVSTPELELFLPLRPHEQHNMRSVELSRKADISTRADDAILLLDRQT
jgi:hypothetical protein